MAGAALIGDSPATKVGQYVVSKLLGAGSFAQVYHAVHEETGQAVALKAIRASSLTPKVVKNLELEIGILRKLRHPNIVSLLDVMKSDHHVFLALEYCQGGDLSHALAAAQPRLPLRTALSYLRQLAAGLEYLHAHSIIHRDLKPQNLLLAGDGTLRIGDFGFARSLDVNDMAATLCGSPLYMAPEVLRRQAYDAKCDLWSLGCIAWELVAGAPPFMAPDPFTLLERITTTTPVMPPDVASTLPPPVLELLKLLLRPDPAERISFIELFAHPVIRPPVQDEGGGAPGAGASGTATPPPTTVSGVGAALHSMAASYTVQSRGAHPPAPRRRRSSSGSARPGAPTPLLGLLTPLPAEAGAALGVPAAKSAALTPASAACLGGLLCLAGQALDAYATAGPGGWSAPLTADPLWAALLPAATPTAPGLSLLLGGVVSAAEGISPPTLHCLSAATWGTAATVLRAIQASGEAAPALGTGGSGWSGHPYLSPAATPALAEWAGDGIPVARAQGRAALKRVGEGAGAVDVPALLLTLGLAGVTAVAGLAAGGSAAVKVDAAAVLPSVRALLNGALELGGAPLLEEVQGGLDLVGRVTEAVG